MFVKDFKKFKSTIEKNISDMFHCTPDEAYEMECELARKFFGKYDLSVIQFNHINPDDRTDLMKYKTLHYFNTIYDKALDLEEALKGVEV